MSANSDEETEFSTSKGAIVPRSNSDAIYATLLELDIKGNSIYAFMRFPVVWKAYNDWRGKIEDGMNFYQLSENKKFDELVAQVFKNKSITDDKKLYNFLLIRYSDSGARKTMNRIKIVLSAFREEYQADINARKTKEQAK